MFNDDISMAIDWDELCEDVHAGGEWKARVIECTRLRDEGSTGLNVESAEKLVTHSLDISTPVILLTAPTIRKALNMQSTSRVPNLHVPTIQLTDSFDGEEQLHWIFRKESGLDKEGTIRTSVTFQQRTSLLNQSQHKFEHQGTLACKRALEDHRDESGEPRLGPRMKTLDEFVSSWGSNKNEDGAKEWSQDGGGVAKQTYQRRRKAVGAATAAAGLKVPSRGAATPLSVWCAGQTSAAAVAEQPAPAATLVVGNLPSGAPALGTSADGDRSGGEGGSDADEETDDAMQLLEIYKVKMAPKAIWETAKVLDRRTRRGAIRHAALDDDVGKAFKKLLLEADKATELLPWLIPDKNPHDLRELVKRFKDKGVVFTINIQKALLGRAAQDVIASVSWAGLTYVADIFVTGAFDGLRPNLGQLACSTVVKIKVFSQIVFTSFIIPSIDYGDGCADRLGVACQDLANKFADVDYVEAEDTLVAELPTWLNIWIGLATLIDADYKHEQGQDAIVTCVGRPPFRCQTLKEISVTL
jgi:hypothetical protein